MLGVSDVGKCGSEPRTINPKGGSLRFRKNQSIQSYCNGERECECECEYECECINATEWRSDCLNYLHGRVRYKRSRLCISDIGQVQGCTLVVIDTHTVFVEEVYNPFVVVLVVHLVQHLRQIGCSADTCCLGA